MGGRPKEEEEEGKGPFPRLETNSPDLRCHYGLWQRDSLPTEDNVLALELGGERGAESRRVRGNGDTYLNDGDPEGKTIGAQVPHGADGISLGAHLPLLASPWGAVGGFVGDGGRRGGRGGGGVERGEMEVVGGEDAGWYDAHHLGDVQPRAA